MNEKLIRAIVGIQSVVRKFGTDNFQVDYDVKLHSWKVYINDKLYHFKTDDGLLAFAEGFCFMSRVEDDCGIMHGVLTKEASIKLTGGNL